jgi:solute:Na+ symporter, SSS family
VLGGMVSIVITDFIQFVALSVGTILVTVWAVHAAGLQKMYESVQATMGLGGFSPIASPDYGWAYIIFQVMVWLAIHTCWQTTAMRTFSTRSPEVSKRVFSWAGFIFLGRGMMPMMWGIAALALLGPKQNSLEAMPRMLASILPSGILGLVVAGMLAATMSVNSSYLLGWSSIIAQDIILPLRRRPLTSRQQVVLNRVANLFVSLFVMFWGLWYTLPGPTYFYLNMTASIYLSGTLVAVVAGLFWNRATTLGGYCAMGGGAIATIGFFFFKTPASYAGLGSFGLAALGMFAGSMLGKRSGRPNSYSPA